MHNSNTLVRRPTSSARDFQHQQASKPGRVRWPVALVVSVLQLTKYGRPYERMERCALCCAPPCSFLYGILTEGNSGLKLVFGPNTPKKTRQTQAGEGWGVCVGFYPATSFFSHSIANVFLPSREKIIHQERYCSLRKTTRRFTLSPFPRALPPQAEMAPGKENGKPGRLFHARSRGVGRSRQLPG